MKSYYVTTPKKYINMQTFLIIYNLMGTRCFCILTDNIMQSIYSYYNKDGIILIIELQKNDNNNLL